LGIIEEGHAALVVQGKFAGADAKGLGAVFQELVKNGRHFFEVLKARAALAASSSSLLQPAQSSER